MRVVSALDMNGEQCGAEIKDYLVDKVLTVVIRQRLCPDDPVQIGLHELLYEIDLAKVVYVGWPEDVEDGDDVLVVKVAEELDLAEGTKTEHGVVEGGDALDGDLATGRDVDC